MHVAHAHARIFFYLAPVSLVRELINSFLMDFSIPSLGLDVLHAYTQSVSLLLILFSDSDRRNQHTATPKCFSPAATAERALARGSTRTLA